jgi:hypothetical protein
MALTRAAACSVLGLLLLATPWPAPMVGLAFVCAGAWLGLTAAHGARRRVR